MLNQINKLTSEEIEKIKTSPNYFFTKYCRFKNGLLETASYLPPFDEEVFFDNNKPVDDFMYFFRAQYRKTSSSGTLVSGLTGIILTEPCGWWPGSWSTALGSGTVEALQA